jgi:hypothetical protein
VSLFALKKPLLASNKLLFASNKLLLETKERLLRLHEQLSQHIGRRLADMKPTDVTKETVSLNPKRLSRKTR